MKNSIPTIIFRRPPTTAKRYVAPDGKVFTLLRDYREYLARYYTDAKYKRAEKRVIRHILNNELDVVSFMSVLTANKTDLRLALQLGRFGGLRYLEDAENRLRTAFKKGKVDPIHAIDFIHFHKKDILLAINIQENKEQDRGRMAA